MNDEINTPDEPEKVSDQDPEDGHLSHEASFDGFVRKHQGYIYGACARISHGRGVDPEETRQEALLQAWRDWPELRERTVEGRLAGIIVRAMYAARRLGREERRSRRRRILDNQEEEYRRKLLASGMDPATVASTMQMRTDLDEVLQTLSETEQEIWGLARSGLTRRHIACNLAMSEKEVRRQLDHANREIRRGLRRRGYNIREGDAR